MSNYKNDLDAIKKLTNAIKAHLDNADIQAGGANAVIACSEANRRIEQARQDLGYLANNLEQYVPVTGKKPAMRRARATVGPGETK